IGGGPNRIGQGIEFDYCCVHASLALREAGFETIMVNSNPETVSTDNDISDRLYFEPVTLEDVLNICDLEKPDGVIVQFGGQTPLNLALKLKKNGVKIIGTEPEAIDAAGNRESFKNIVSELGLYQPTNDSATSLDDALDKAKKIGYPVVVRPSFVLGGRAMEIVYGPEQLKIYFDRAVSASPDAPVLIDQFLEDAIEVDVDCIRDGEITVIGAVMEHIEEAGIHSGDSACVIPVFRLQDKVGEEMRRATVALAERLGVKGLMNVQYAVKH
ncbi:MAG: ATP-grasp domain-containing protein, partial [Planctomycetes bacterium]|nr:ATP-grasp domain-containing protein [Planctomycetota bacterium]